MSTVAEAAQRAEALRRAEQVRLARAAFKRRLARGASASESRRLAADLVTEVPDVLATMRVAQLVGACYSVGPVMVARYVEAAGLRGNEELGGLTVRQRALLAGALRLRPVRIAA